MLVTCYFCIHYIRICCLQMLVKEKKCKWFFSMTQLEKSLQRQLLFLQLALAVYVVDTWFYLSGRKKCNLQKLKVRKYFTIGTIQVVLTSEVEHLIYSSFVLLFVILFVTLAYLTVSDISGNLILCWKTYCKGSTWKNKQKQKQTKKKLLVFGVRNKTTQINCSSFSPVKVLIACLPSKCVKRYQMRTH